MGPVTSEDTPCLSLRFRLEELSATVLSQKAKLRLNDLLRCVRHLVHESSLGVDLILVLKHDVALVEFQVESLIKHLGSFCIRSRDSETPITVQNQVGLWILNLVKFDGTFLFKKLL